MIDEVDQDQEIKSIVVECSFPNDMELLARDSKHLTPKLLFNKIEALKRDNLNLYINHMKPFYIAEIVEGIEEYKGKWEPILLKDGDLINF